MGWTEDDDGMNAGSAPMINSEEAMKPSITKFAPGLEADQLSQLLSLYPLADFEEDVRNYDARRGADDPPISAHYYAAARILRDMLFTCSSFEFTYQAMKQARTDPTHKSQFKNVHVYALNQSVFNPLWNAVGMPWMGASHGSDLPYIFNGVFPEGTLSEQDLKLSKQLSSALITYAHTGDPVAHANATADASGSLDSWPEAYDYPENDEDDLMPSHFNLLVLGGAYGTQVVSLCNSTQKHENIFREKDPTSLEVDGGFASNVSMGKLQDVVANTLGMEAMNSSDVAALHRRIEHQKLFIAGMKPHRSIVRNSTTKTITMDGFER
ncbi:MAG: hypothetical protein Q9162_007187 [Coniocarpon cinnabarinum]